MWVNLAIWVVLLLISSALLVRSRLDKTRVIDWRFLILGSAVFGFANVFTLELKNDYVRSALLLFSFLLVIIYNPIAVLILRRRVTPPRVPVKRTTKFRTYSSIAIIFVFAFFIYISNISDLHSFEKMFLQGYMAIVMIIAFFLILFEKVDICGDGVLDGGGLWPWDRYKSFS
jgi:hypothetical protein